MKIKTRIVIILTLSLMFTLTGCNKTVDRLYSNGKDYVKNTVNIKLFENTKNAAKENMVSFLRMLREKENINTVKELFCKHTKDNVDLDNELQSAIDFIEGKVIYYDKYHLKTEVLERNYADGIDKIKITCVFIDTNVNKHYMAIETLYAMNKKNPEYEGVLNFELIEIGDDAKLTKDDKNHIIVGEECD